MRRDHPNCTQCSRPATLVRMHPTRPKYACSVEHMPDAENMRNNRTHYGTQIVLDVEAEQQLVCGLCMRVTNRLHARHTRGTIMGLCDICELNIRS